MPSRHLLSAAAFLLAALGCDAESSTEPMPTSTPEIFPEAAELAVSSAANTWTTRRDMPSTTRYNVATASFTTASGNSLLYILGGVTPSGGSLSRVQVYDTDSNIWTWKPELPRPLKATNGAVVIKGKIYIAGGITTGDKGYSYDLYVFDPAANRWTVKQEMPKAGYSGFTGVIDHKLYMVTYCDDCVLPGRWLLRYDPATDTWTELATPPRDVRGGVGGVIGNKFYVGPRFERPEVLDVYDAATNTWTQRSTNLAVRSAGASTVMNGKLYMIGGMRRNADGTWTAVRATNVYDPATNRWTSLAPMPSTRFGMVAAKVFLNGQPRIELVGGPAPGNNLQYAP